MDTFYNIIESVRLTRKQRRSVFLREAGIGSQHMSYMKDHEDYTPTPDIMDRLQTNLNIRFVFDKALKIVGWEDADSPTPASVRDVISQPLEGAYQEYTGQVRRLLEEYKGNMDATTSKKLEAEFDILLSRMEDVKDEANHQLRKLLREAERLVKAHQMEVGDDEDNRTR